MIYHLRLQPSEIEALDYYEYWYFIKDLSKVLEEKNKESSRMNDEINEQRANQPKLKQPKMPSIKMPKLNSPKL